MLQKSSSHGNHLGWMLPSLTSPKPMILYLACNFGTICNALPCLHYFSRQLRKCTGMMIIFRWMGKKRKEKTTQARSGCVH
eukprot:311209-Pelagomonas_calceolata.AAC.1